MITYQCRVPSSISYEGTPDHKSCPLVSEYFAKNNKAKYGHICKSHYNSMDDAEKNNYELG